MSIIITTWPYSYPSYLEKSRIIIFSYRFMSNEYFDQNSASWRVLDFLNKCKLEPFQLKIDYYIKCLTTIVDNEQGDRKDSAQLLLNRYRKASKYYFFTGNICEKSGVIETYLVVDYSRLLAKLRNWCWRAGSYLMLKATCRSNIGPIRTQVTYSVAMMFGGMGNWSY